MATPDIKRTMRAREKLGKPTKKISEMQETNYRKKRREEIVNIWLVLSEMSSASVPSVYRN